MRIRPTITSLPTPFPNKQHLPIQNNQMPFPAPIIHHPTFHRQSIRLRKQTLQRKNFQKTKLRT